MKFTEAIRVFDLHLGAERNVSPNTRRAYAADVRSIGEGNYAGSKELYQRLTDVDLAKGANLYEPGFGKHT